MRNKILIVLSVLLYLYFWTATASHFTFSLDRNHDGTAYNLLAKSLLSGHLYLPIEPSKELLSLSDPYDPVLNGPYRKHDLSLYKGKYYLYFGISPVIVNISYFLFTKHTAPDSFVVFIFCFGSLIWIALFILHLKKSCFFNIPDWVFYFTLCVIGLSNFHLYNLRRPEVYEIAISSGQFFLTGAIYLLSTAFTKPNNVSKLKLSIGSLFLSLAVGARPQFILDSIILIPVAKKIFDLNRDNKTFLIRLLFLFVPYVICLCFLGLYNYFRFDNPFDFGNAYQLAGVNMKTIKPSLEYIVPGFYYFLLQVPTINSTFPFVHPIANLPKSLVPSLPYYNEKIVGLLPGVPFVCLFFIAPFYYWLQMLRSCKVTCFKNRIIKKGIICVPLIYIALYLTAAITDTIHIKCFEDLSFFINKTLSVTPVVLIIFLCFMTLIFYWILKINLNCITACALSKRFPWFEFILVLLPACLNMGIFFLLPMITLRYLADFTTLFIISAAIVWFYFNGILKKQSRFILDLISIFLGVISMLFGLAFGVIGCYSGLRDQNPNLYSELAQNFSFIADIIKSFSY